jgi:hypothetical protein
MKTVDQKSDSEKPSLQKNQPSWWVRALLSERFRAAASGLATLWIALCLATFFAKFFRP